MERKILNIAHRGASELAPENTLPAFIKAIECGADIIELDVHLTADGEIVVTHDESIRRITGEDGKIKRLEFNFLRSLDFGKWFSEQFAGEKIPSLREVFEKLGDKIKFNIEIKMGEKYYPGIVDRLLELINHYRMKENVILSSFDLKTIKILSEKSLDIPLGIIFDRMEWDYLLKSAKKINCSFIVPDKRITTEREIEKAHRIGLSVYPYVINEKEEIQKFIKYGVDGIITNNPERVSKILRNYSTV